MKNENLQSPSPKHSQMGQKIELAEIELQRVQEYHKFYEKIGWMAIVAAAALSPLLFNIVKSPSGPVIANLHQVNLVILGGVLKTASDSFSNKSDRALPKKREYYKVEDSIIDKG